MKNILADMVHLQQEVVMVMLMFGMEITRRDCTRFFPFALTNLRGPVFVMVLDSITKLTFLLPVLKISN